MDIYLQRYMLKALKGSFVAKRVKSYERQGGEEK